ncbi:Delta 8 Fatty Acid Desaturase, partial [Bachmanniomyces sp. S44760]|nr:Delta 8 Fatty Acid Desaturase [Bachmanniomyces sp. S44760]
IEGRWLNFLPPIQGGRFGRYHGEDDCAIVESKSNASSKISSPSLSPLFDTEDTRSHGPSSRNAARSHELSPTSSVSSLDLEHADAEDQKSYMDEYTQGEIDSDLAKYPALDPMTQDGIVNRYRGLDQQIKAEGLYNCNYTAYGNEMCRYTFLFGMCFVFLDFDWYLAAGLSMGAFWHQLVFTAHDAGHMGITHDFTIDTVIGIIIADFLGGLSLGWWKRNHNVHHIVTNSPEHDPDIEHMPFFAISHRFLTSLRSTYYDRIMTYDPFAKFVVRYQKYLYYPILTLGRFNLYRLSWEYLLLGQAPKNGPAWWHRWLEIAGQFFFWTWYGYFVVYRNIPTASGRFAFVMASHMITGSLHVQITLSHFAMSTADLGVNESFPQKMLRTTMDVDCPPWLDWFHGGLQFQAIHHLYPRIPRHNLRRTQKLVQNFCKDVGIPYALYGFIDGNKEVLGKLGQVGRQAAILAECQRTIADKGKHGHHH